MKHSKAIKILSKAVKAKEPILLVGAPGIGKTDLWKAVVKAVKARLVLFHPVVSDPTDFKGMPAISVSNGVSIAQFLPFSDLQVLIDAKELTIAFFDDLGQASPSVQAAIMQLVLGRKINGHEISEHVVFVAATNRRQDQAAVTGLIAPLLDRFSTVLEIDVDKDEWEDWYLDQVDLPLVVLSFIRFRPELLHAWKPSKDMTKTPTPRAWHGLARLIQIGLDDLEVLKGAVGEGAATEFYAFYKTWKDLPDVAEVFLNPSSTNVPTKPDVLYALMGALASEVEAEPQMESLLTYLTRLPRKDFAMLCIKDVTARKPALAKTKAFINFAIKNKALFGAAQKVAN